MVTHASVVYDIDDFKVYPLVTDTSGSPTYGAGIDVPGIAEVSMDPNLVTGELKGDARIIAKKGRIDRFNFSATYGKLAMDALAVMVGGTVTDNANNATYAIGGTNSLPYFKAGFRILDADVPSIHVIAYKCQVTGGSLLDQSSDEFGQPSIDFEGIPSQADPTKFLEIIFHDSVVAL
jgi:hypothetical protein